MEAIGDAVDQLLTVDAGGRGVIGELADAARQYHGRSPTLEAAERLEGEVSEGDDVLIVTGFLVPPTLAQETDGPVGAASLARAIKLGLGAHPTVLAEGSALPMIEAAARAYGLDVVDDDRGREGTWTCSVDSYTTDANRMDDAARETLDEYDPAAVVAIERAGANQNGEYHSMVGTNITEHSAKTEPLIETTDALTIGIGDGGNEVGMGVIEDTVREHVPRANDCGCGCGGGITADSETDVVIPATVSNWGAYGIGAVLSAMVDEPLLQDPELEERALVESALAGAIDGPTGKTTGACDGLPASAHASVVELLQETVSESNF